MDFTNGAAVAVLLDVLTTAQRLIAVAGACTKAGVMAGTRASGWRDDEVEDCLEFLTESRYLWRVADGDDFVAYFAGPSATWIPH